jgi:hypothetical protein
VRSDELAGAGRAAGGFNLQANRHRGILTDVRALSLRSTHLSYRSSIIEVWIFHKRGPSR